MKNSIGFTLLLSVTLLVQQSIGQTPNLPIDQETGKILFSKVVHLDSSTTKNELFLRAKEWFARSYNSSMDVIQMADADAGKVIGKAQIKVFALTGHLDGHINYTIVISLRNGRYKYEVTDLHHKGTYRSGYTVPDYGPCEKMIKTTDKTLGISHQKTYDKYLNEANESIKTLISSLETAMSQPSVGNGKDDW
jgi:hypothetical protein